VDIGAQRAMEVQASIPCPITGDDESSHVNESPEEAIDLLCQGVDKVTTIHAESLRPLGTIQTDSGREVAGPADQGLPV